MQGLKLNHGRLKGKLLSAAPKLGEQLAALSKSKWRHEAKNWDETKLRIPLRTLLVAALVKVGTTDDARNGLEYLAHEVEDYLINEKHLTNIKVHCGKGHIRAEGFVSRSQRIEVDDGLNSREQRVNGA